MLAEKKTEVVPAEIEEAPLTPQNSETLVQLTAVCPRRVLLKEEFKGEEGYSLSS